MCIRDSYKYLQDCAGPGFPASRAARFLETMGFLQGVFGFRMGEILFSKRINGFAKEQTARLGIRKQSATVPFWVTRALEYKI
eukprot:10282433-Karenia_brevis.AAC.1